MKPSIVYTLTFAGSLALGMACSGAVQPSPSCSDEAYRTQLLNCGIMATSCVQKGGNDAECGGICDQEWAAWQERCSQ